MSESVRAVIKECNRQVENYEHTAAGLFAVVRLLTIIRFTLSTLAIVLGGVSGLSLLKGQTGQISVIVVAVSALLAGLIPTLLKSFRIEEGVAEAKSAAGEFIALRNRFRFAATVLQEKTLEEIRAETDPLFDRLEQVNLKAVAVPSWAFKNAQRKISAGHYNNSINAEDGNGPAKP